MCLILMAYRVHPRYPLILAANRDEFYDRPTAAAGFWEGQLDLLAGKDLVHGGTWLGVTRQGRLGAVTNYRDPRHVIPDARSRGELVTSFLCSAVDAGGFLANLGDQSAAYNGFNLLVGDVEQLLYFSNRAGKIVPIEPGIHGVSNHLLDTPWPKVARGKELLARAVAAGDVSAERLFTILADREKPCDAELPATGVSLEWERLLSSIFIVSPTYGTRASTVLLVNEHRELAFVERSFPPVGDPITREVHFSLEAGASPEAVPSCHFGARRAGAPD
ncbi:NRDE family protein [Geomesophilobacter sediminis]|uniref:NRDE family protein n=1 Tax=Geomesophilobacter sediminis TaxID=2798584 RepID=A0A8J7J0C9_9BACT|nr:NRDE family protein [Geomesophilobacter sediminis]MBJ6726002.1 NRDE family protein [Geomesophilobacter sediminis]